jgi:murein hydrolase activator
VTRQKSIKQYSRLQIKPNQKNSPRYGFQYRALLPLLHTASLVLFIVAMVLSPTSMAAPQQELEELRARINALQQELGRNEESKAEAVDALKESERAISDSNRKLFDLSKQLRSADSALERLQEQKKLVNAALESQKSQLGKLFYQQYLEGAPGPLKLVLNGENPQSIARKLYYYSYISRARLSVIQGLQKNLADLQDLSLQTQLQRTELEAIKVSQIDEKKRLSKEKQQRQQMLVKVSGQIKKQKNEITTLKKDENRLAKLVKNLSKLLAQRQSNKGLSNSKLPDASLHGTPFKELKGKLNLPVRGEISNTYGSMRVGSGVYWRGLFILAKAAQEVRAIASGRVVFADWLRGFGNLLILDHDDGYMSLYGNNETLYKQVGEIVRVGDTIAAVGNTGGNTESGLYFEIRYQGEPFDPLSWVSIK